MFRPFESYFSDYPDLVQPYLPGFATEFVNLQQVSAEQILALTNGLLKSAIMVQKYYFDPESLKKQLHAILENLVPYLGMNIVNSIFVYIMQGANFDAEYFKESVNNLSVDMSTKMMSVYDQLIAQGKVQGIAEGKVQGIVESMVQTILRAYDAGINLATIKIITGESEEKINQILKQNNRIR